MLALIAFVLFLIVAVIRFLAGDIVSGLGFTGGGGVRLVACVGAAGAGAGSVKAGLFGDQGFRRRP